MPSDPHSKVFNTEILPVLTSTGFRSLCRKLAANLTTFSDADDFVQAASLRAWSARASFVSGGSAKAWCHVIARNVAFTAASKRKRDQRNVSAAVHDPEFGAAHLTYRTPGLPTGVMMDTSASVEEQLDTAAEWRAVSADMASLSQTYSDALDDQYLKGEDWNESAAKRGCPRGTILSRRIRGIRALRQVA